MYKFIVLAVVVAVAKAGYLGAPAVAAYGAPAYGYGGYAAPAYGYAGSAYGYGGYASPAITSQHSNILRTPGNLGQVSTYSKTIDTPYSSVSKSDVRVSNPGVAYGATYHAPAYGAYAAPAVHGAYAAPAYASYAAPAYAQAYAAPAAYAAHGLAYSPAAVASHVSFSGLGAYYGY